MGVFDINTNEKNKNDNLSVLHLPHHANAARSPPVTLLLISPPVIGLQSAKPSHITAASLPMHSDHYHYGDTPVL